MKVYQLHWVCWNKQNQEWDRGIDEEIYLTKELAEKYCSIFNEFGYRTAKEQWQREENNYIERLSIFNNENEVLAVAGMDITYRKPPLGHTPLMFIREQYRTYDVSEIETVDK